MYFVLGCSLRLTNILNLSYFRLIVFKLIYFVLYFSYDHVMYLDIVPTPSEATSVLAEKATPEMEQLVCIYV